MKWTFVPHNQHPVRLRALLPFLLLLSGTWFLARYLPASRQAGQQAGTAFLLTGSVRSVTTTEWGCHAVVRQNGGSLIYLNCSQMLEPGSRISVRVLAERPAGRRNPGGFDESAWLLSQGILLKAEPIKGSAVLVTRQPCRLSLLFWITRIRLALRAALARLLPARSADLLAALLLGDKSGLSTADRLDFSQAGLVHLTAVSGMHLSCLLQPLNRLLRRCRLRSASRYRLMLAFLIFFGFLTGWRVSIFRAAVMAAAPLAGKQLLRRTEPFYSLVIALLLLILVNPFAVLDSGFWMTFSATAAVIRLAGPMADRLQRLLPQIPGGLLSAVSLVVSAQLATAPFVLGTGGSLSLAGMAVNVPAGALTGLILWFGLALLPLGLLGVWLPAVSSLLLFLARPLDYLLNLLRCLAGWTARIRPGRIYGCQLNLIWAAALLLLAIWCLCRFGILPKMKILPGRLALLIVCLFLAGSVWQLAAFWLAPPVSVWFFDVGQGDAILIRDRQGRSVLIDGGRTGQGLSVLVQALDALGVNQVDLAIATHADDDHIGGLAELADYGRIRRLVLTGGLLDALQGADRDETDAEYGGLATLIRLVSAAGYGVRSVAAHDTMALGGNIKLTVLAPPDDLRISREAITDGNAWSLLLLADLAGRSLLLTADCTAAAEQRLVDQLAWPQADVLKVAHHGSAQTTQTAMLAQVRPVIAVISVGTNWYGHPADAVLERLQGQGCPVFRTDESGAVCIGFSAERLIIRTYCRLG